jgi:hypothetical protein
MQGQSYTAIYIHKYLCINTNCVWLAGPHCSRQETQLDRWQRSRMQLLHPEISLVYDVAPMLNMTGRYYLDTSPEMDKAMKTHQ